MKVFYLFLFLLLNINSFAQWTALNAVPENVDLNSIFFIDDSNGWVCGANGIILCFDSDSLKWDRVNTNSAYLLNSISFINASTGFAVGNKGLILKSTNGGYDWTEIHYDSTFHFRSIYIINSTVFIVGTKGKIFRSTDTGLTWTDLSYGTLNLNAVHFPDGLNGFVGADSNYILITADGGLNWEQMLIFQSNMEDHCTAVFFIDSLTGFVGGGTYMTQYGGYLRKTTDGGNSWTGWGTEGRVKSMNFTDSNNGIIVGGSLTWNRFLCYYNQGTLTYRINWYEGLDINSCFITESGKGWAVGAGANMLNADNFRERWDQLFMGSDSQVQGFAVSSDNVFYVTSTRNNYIAGLGVLMRSFGGSLMLRDAFSHQDYGTGIEYFSGVTAIDSMKVLVAGDLGATIRSVDGGNTWSFGGDSDNFKMFFVNDSIGWGLKQQYYWSSLEVVKTTDFGYTCITQLNIGMKELFFVNETIGFVSGSNCIMKTSNGGEDWVTVLTPAASIEALYFFDENTGYAAGNNNTFLKTTDGGISWEYLNFAYTGNHFTDMWFKSNVGFLAGSGGMVYKTSDYGNTWLPQQVTPSGNFSFVVMDNLNRVAVSQWNQIYLSSHEPPVPVELISFTGYAYQNNVELNWSTATETNNSGFEIEKCSLVKAEWVGIYFVECKGNSSERQSYSFQDKDIAPGKYKYRLKQIDFDGSFEYSNVIEVEVKGPLEFVLHQNYPNPFNPGTIIKFALPVSVNKVSLTIYDITGTEIAVLVHEEKSAGEYQVEWNASAYSSGVYFYKLTAGEFTSTKKLLLMK